MIMEDDFETLECRDYRGYTIAVLDTTGELKDRYFIVTGKDGETAEFWDLDEAERYIDELEDGPGESYEEANAEHVLGIAQLI
jgi:hypothetical protein